MAATNIPAFQTQEWADQLKAFLNKNPNYKDSAKMWEGALVLEFISEKKKLPRDVYIWMDIWHGECRGIQFLQTREEKPAAYYITANESTWLGIVQKPNTAQSAMLSGKVKLKGDMAKLMRFPKAAAYIMKYLARLLQNW